MSMNRSRSAGVASSIRTSSIKCSFGIREGRYARTVTRILSPQMLEHRNYVAKPRRAGPADCRAKKRAPGLKPGALAQTAGFSLAADLNGGSTTKVDGAA